MSWLAESGTFLVAGLVLMGPGAAAALIVGLRRFSALAVAAPLSAAGLTAAALVNVLVPFRWSSGAWLVSVGVLMLAAVGVRQLVRRFGSTPRPPRRRLTLLDIAPFVVVLACAIMTALRVTSAIGDPTHLSQTFDNIYHLNAVRQVMDEGAIAPTRQMLPGFYPDLWHVVVATVAEISGAGVVESVNAVSVMLSAVVWPVACVWLVRVIGGNGVVLTAAAGVLSVGMAAFPLLMLDFGVLYPNVMSIALLPSLIAAFVLVSERANRGERVGPVVHGVLLIAILPTVALAHPSTLMASMIPAFWLGIPGYLRWHRRAVKLGRPRRVRVIAAIAAVVLLVLAAVLFIVARPSRELAYWPPSATLGEAVQQLISNGLVWRSPSWTVSVLVALGILTICLSRRWRRHWWLIASAGTVAFIYVVCISFPAGGFRYGISGTWYQDVYRIAALVPVFLVPLGALGVVGVVQTVRRVLRRDDGHARSARFPVAVGAVIVVATLGLTQLGPGLTDETANTAAMYRENSRSPLLTSDERALLERLTETVPVGDVIVGNPWTGTSLSYAIADRAALVPHIFQELTPDMRTITERLNRAGTDPDVCAALESTRTRWVLDFGSDEIHGGDHSYPGLKDLGDVVRLVDSQGDARLYEIVACR